MTVLPSILETSSAYSTEVVGVSDDVCMGCAEVAAERASSVDREVGNVVVCSGVGESPGSPGQL